MLWAPKAYVYGAAEISVSRAAICCLSSALAGWEIEVLDCSFTSSIDFSFAAV